MLRIRLTLFTAFLAAAGLAACANDSTTQFRSAVTGEACEPDPATYTPKAPKDHGNGGHNSPTGIPGDNIDDEHSGKVDCLGDGDSGQGNDDKKCGPPGCDAEMCCEPGGGDDDDDEDTDEGSDEGCGDDDETPPAPEEPPPPPQEPPGPVFY